jgi:coproporphyrinogen III oxidase-like Fe-S oxidoreductase
MKNSISGVRFQRYITGFVDRLIQTFPESTVYDPEKIYPLEHLGVYIHIPFCKTECAFCAFSKERDSDGDRKERYVQALAHQIGRVASVLPENQIDWIYFGGGTPSALELDQLQTVLHSLRGFHNIHPHASITMEARVDNLGDWIFDQKELGITRWSVGVQTLDDAERKQYGLQLSSAEVIQRLRKFEEHGLEYNVDLIFGGPDQTFAMWQRTLDEIMLLRPPEITTYMYMPLAGTESWQKRGIKKDWLAWKRQQFAMTTHLLDVMGAHGYRQTDTFMFSRVEDIAGKLTPYADISMIATPIPILGFGQSAYSLLPHVIAVNPYDIDGFIQHEEKNAEAEYVGRKNDLLLQGLRNAARLTSRLSSHKKPERNRLDDLRIFFTYCVWTEIYRIARDWNTLSPRVGYHTTPLSRHQKLAKNLLYQAGPSLAHQQGETQ